MREEGGMLVQARVSDCISDVNEMSATSFLFGACQSIPQQENPGDGSSLRGPLKRKWSFSDLRRGIGRVEILIGLFIGLFGLAFGVHVWPTESLDRFAETLGTRARHPALQVAERQVEILGDVQCCHTLAKILATGACSLQISTGNGDTALAECLGQRCVQFGVAEH